MEADPGQNSTRSSLPSLALLVKQYFPPETWTERPTADEGVKILELQNTHLLNYQDLQLCRDHARSIQCLGYEMGSGDNSAENFTVWELSPEVYDHLQFYRVIPLPNLRSFLVRTESEFLTLDCVVGPNTINLEFASLDYEAAILALELRRVLGPEVIQFDFISLGYKPALFTYHWQRPVVVPLPPSVRSLRLRDPCLPDEISASLLNYFNGDPHLESLHIPTCETLKEADFRAVMSLSTLQELEIGEMKEGYLSFIPSPSPQRIRHLHFTVNNRREVIQFLQKIGYDGSSCLQSIKIGYDNPFDSMPPPALEVKDFFSQLQSSCNTKRLSVVSIFYFISNPHERTPSFLFNDQQYAITLDTVGPLFMFENLHELRIRYLVDTMGIFECIFLVNEVSGENNRMGSILKEWKVGDRIKESSTDVFQF